MGFALFKKKHKNDDQPLQPNTLHIKKILKDRIKEATVWAFQNFDFMSKFISNLDRLLMFYATLNYFFSSEMVGFKNVIWAKPNTNEIISKLVNGRSDDSKKCSFVSSATVGKFGECLNIYIVHS